MRPLAIDLFCGLGGWTEGLLATGWDVIGFDIEAHAYDGERYPAQLVLQDVRTLRGSQFKDADLIVASPPCQAYSYMAMPWTRAKARAAAIRADETGEELRKLNELFNACFRIQREACEAAGRHIPMVVENVKGAQPWVGRANFNFGSYHPWGDVPALMPMALRRDVKVGGVAWYPKDDPRWRPGMAFNPGAQGRSVREARAAAGYDEGAKVPGFRFDGSGRSFQTASVEGLKRPGISLREEGFNCTMARELSPSIPRGSIKLSPDDKRQHLSGARKAASARIAKIPLALSTWIGRVWLPREKVAA